MRPGGDPSRIHTGTSPTLKDRLPCGPAQAKADAGMLDVIFIIGGTAFFVAAVGYTLLCEQL